MIWDLLLVAAVVVEVVLIVKAVHSPQYSDWRLAAGLWSLPLVVMLVVSAIGTAANQYDNSTYTHSSELVTMKRDQRDELAGIVKAELSTSEFAKLMAAQPEADVLVILGNHAATDLLVERSRTLVALNGELNRMLNDLASKRIALCSWADNVLTPRLFVAPHCPAPLPSGVAR